MKVKLDKGAYMPTKAHSADAGFDLYSPVEVMVAPGGSVTIDTGVHMAIPIGYAGLLVSKSGLNVNHGILSTGLIDAGYTGSIRVKLYNHSDAHYCVWKGDKISQLVLIPVIMADLEKVYELDETERGNGGFGSSGR